MFEVTKKATFAAAHFLRNYDGPCARLHGHNWTVEVTVRAPKVDPMGMVVDFMDLGAAMDELLEMVDHRNLNEIPPFIEVNPTSENLAAWFHQELERRLAPKGIRPHVVRIWEMPDCSAAYWKE
ncbi:MAG: 6-carboxytetrahydropterin synthase QueD [Candidatus Eisenbacteria bacterium]|nr:6-carboxytetrahydropterin synthase QueD [Candidatus Eisenbacteria bacterium]